MDNNFVLLDNWFTTYYTKTAYETIKTEATYILKNQTLKKKSLTYMNIFTYLSQDVDKSEWSYSNAVKKPILTKYFKDYEVKSGEYWSIPVDYDNLKITTNLETC